MSDVKRWMSERRPEPPVDLDRWVVESGDDALDSLTRNGTRALQLAIQQPGRVRSAAFDLLAADALLTYAAEAALETPDPEGALRRLLYAAARA